MSNKKDQFYVMRDFALQKGLYDLIEYIENNSNKSTKEMQMIEIGTYTGDSTLLFANKFKTVISVDPFLDDYDAADDACNYASFDKVFNEFTRRTKDIENISLIRAKSDDATPNFKKAEFDFIYIDGMHTYEQVKKDIHNYLPFVKKGGFIAGHDYVPGFQGVMNAVNEKFGTPNQVFSDTSWIVKVL